MEKLLIGLDFGSDSVRAVLVAANGEQLATSVHEYARWAQGKYCDPAANQFRQHPLDYLEGTEAVIRNVLKGVDATRVAGIAIDTTGSTPCAVMPSGVEYNKLRPEDIVIIRLDTGKPDGAAHRTDPPRCATAQGDADREALFAQTRQQRLLRAEVTFRAPCPRTLSERAAR